MNAFAHFRRTNPTSRAQSWITTYGSGSKRRTYTCVACRRVVDTESASYRQTVHAAEAIAEHVASCREIARYDWPAWTFVALGELVAAVLGLGAPIDLTRAALAGEVGAVEVLRDWCESTGRRVA